MTLNKGNYRILIIEDNPGDFTLIEEFLLEQIESPEIFFEQTFSAARKTLLANSGLFDIILLDLSLPDKTGINLIKEIIEICPQLPIIVLTGYADLDFGLKSLSLGISDYILKDELTSVNLYKSILYSLERKRTITALEQSKQRYSELFHLSPLPMWVFDLETLHFLDVNKAAIRNYGYTLEEFLSMTLKDIRPQEEIPMLETVLNKNLEYSYHRGIFSHIKKDGQIIKVDIQSNLIEFNGKQAKVTIATDITEKLNYINAIEKQNEKFKEIAWIQSHVVRAPLARLMGLIQLIKDEYIRENETEQILDYITSSAHELDRIIKDISNKATEVEYDINKK
jgi:PAS domain S-box-containing protein